MRPPYVVASMAVAIATSGLALLLAGGRSGRPPLILSAIALGFAISGMHYTAMDGLTLHPHASSASTAPALSTDLLAIVVAIVAFGVSAIFLLSLVPDHARGAGSEPRARPPALDPHPCPSPKRGGDSPRRGGKSNQPRSPAAAPELGRGGYGPLGGAGGPPRTSARQLPIERDGGTQFVAVEDIVAIHANAHYTTIFNGQEKLFCPLAIGDVEQRLDHDRFIRVHRSHIVNIERVVGQRRTGDNELIEIVPTTTRCRSAAAGSAR